MESLPSDSSLQGNKGVRGIVKMSHHVVRRHDGVHGTEEAPLSTLEFVVK